MQRNVKPRPSIGMPLWLCFFRRDERVENVHVTITPIEIPICLAQRLVFENSINQALLC